AQSSADDGARGGNDEDDLRLRVVPARSWMQTGIGAVTHRRHGLSFGEDFRIRPDADFEILRPHVPRQQHLLELERFLRAGLELRKIIADEVADTRTNGKGGIRIAAGALLDHALQHRDGEGDAGSLDRLKIYGCEKPWP